MWWMIALLIGGGALVLLLGVLGVRRATRGMRERLGYIMDALDEAIAADKEPEKPRSLSSLESVVLPKILKDFPEFNPSGPIWRVVRSTASSGGGSGSGSGSLVGNRTTPRTARVNEDDDDLSL